MSARASLSIGDLCRGVRVVAARELGAYFDSLIAYVVIILFVVLSNFIFMTQFFLTGRVEMKSYFMMLPVLLNVSLPAVTMRLWAEERRQRTMELLLTLPIVPMQAILGKFLASLALYAFFLIGSLPIVIMLAMLGKPDYGMIIGGYIGAGFLGAFFLAFGMFLSALSADQIVAFVTTAVVGYVFVGTGDDRFVAWLDGVIPSAALGTVLRDSISVVPHYESFVSGVLDLTSIVYFGSFIAAFLWLSGVTVEKTRA
ncbi:MAG: ABC transporter permease [Planctomycetes bacterium]|nr:ABC transporter permease [Planctomycetota bacterium]